MLRLISTAFYKYFVEIVNHQGWVLDECVYVPKEPIWQREQTLAKYKGLSREQLAGGFSIAEREYLMDEHPPEEMNPITEESLVRLEKKINILQGRIGLLEEKIEEMDRRKDSIL